MKKVYSQLAIVLVMSCASLFALPAVSEEQAKTVVMVHGAFADGSSWNKVIPLLQEKGLKTISVQNPLTSLADDIDYTNRAIEQAQGPVVLVGHSWGGMVITEAGMHDKVKSLVYVSAFAPSEGEHIHSILHDAHDVQKIPHVPGFAAPIVDKQGFIELSEETIVKYFTSDLPASEAKLIVATQGKLHKDTLDQAVKASAWKTKPSWFILSAKDQMIAPDVMRLMAEKIKATTKELPTSHVPMLSQPNAVAEIILDAARGK